MLRAIAILTPLVGLLSNCTALQEQFAGRYGPAPVPTAAFVEDSARRQTDIVWAMVQGAGFSTWPAIGDRKKWFLVLETGFNVVNDACMSYVDDLWILERRKARNGALITAIGTATSGIVAANANPSAITLAILTQAFGLASAMNTAISDSYLYTQNAATIKKLVQKTFDAYRNDVATNIGKSEINYPLASPGAAYHHMREYLSLCLPPTIQAQIEDLVTKAKAAPEDSAEERSKKITTTRTGSKSKRTSPSITVF